MGIITDGVLWSSSALSQYIVFFYSCRPRIAHIRYYQIEDPPIVVVSDFHLSAWVITGDVDFQPPLTLRWKFCVLIGVVSILSSAMHVVAERVL